MSKIVNQIKEILENNKSIKYDADSGRRRIYVDKERDKIYIHVDFEFYGGGFDMKELNELMKDYEITHLGGNDNASLFITYTKRLNLGIEDEVD